MKTPYATITKRYRLGFREMKILPPDEIAVEPSGCTVPLELYREMFAQLCRTEQDRDEKGRVLVGVLNRANAVDRLAQNQAWALVIAVLVGGIGWLALGVKYFGR